MNAKNIKMYGMTPKNWTVKEKIFQFGALERLMARDQGLVTQCSKRMIKDNSRRIRQLKAIVRKDRLRLRNCPEIVRQTLENQGTFKLACAGLKPHQIPEWLEQELFHRRKALDKLRYQARIHTEQLHDLLLMEARIVRAYDPVIQKRIRQEEQVLFKKIQTEALKVDSSDSLNALYKVIYDVLKKDSLFFDSVLVAFQRDVQDQMECVYRILEKGQVAKEDFGNVKHSYDILETETLEHMLERDKSVKNLQKEVNRMLVICRRLTCRSAQALEETQSTRLTDTLWLEVQQLEEYMKSIEHETHTYPVSDVYVRLLEQGRQRQLLLQMVDDNLMTCERLSVERDSLVEEVQQMKHTFFQEGEENEVLQHVADARSRLHELTETLSARSYTITHIHAGLQLLHDQLINCVSFPASEDDVEIAVSSLTSDTLQLLESVRQKVAYLVMGVKTGEGEGFSNTDNIQRAFGEYGERVQNKFSMEEYSRGESFESPLHEIGEFLLADPKVFTRKQIKKWSTEMAEYCSKPPITYRERMLCKFKSRLGRATHWL